MKLHCKFLFLALLIGFGNCSRQVSFPQFKKDACAHGHICCEVGCYCCKNWMMPKIYAYHDTLRDTLLQNLQRITFLQRYRKQALLYDLKESRLVHVVRAGESADFKNGYSILYRFIKGDKVLASYYSLKNANQCYYQDPVKHKLLKTALCTDFTEELTLVTKQEDPLDYSFINKTGEELPVPYQSSSPFAFGLQKVSVVIQQASQNENTPIWQAAPAMELKCLSGITNMQGKKVSPLKYARIFPLIKGIAKVSLNEKGGPYGFIDSLGKEVIPCVYDFVGNFSEGACAVCKNRKWAYVNVNGKMLTDFIYDETSPFSEGLAFVVCDEKKYFIDKTGRKKISLKYNDVNAFSEGMAMVNKVTNLDPKIKERDRKQALKRSYRKPHTDFTSTNNAGFINKKGKIIIDLKYRYAESFAEGFAAVWFPDASFHFIDKNEKELLLQCKYNYAKGFKQGLAYVRRNKWIGFIDSTGKEIIPSKHFFVGPENDTSYFPHGHSLFESDEKKGLYFLLDRSGKDSIALKGQVSPVSKYENETNAPFLTNLVDSKKGLIDFKGKVILPCRYDQIITLSNGFFAVMNDFRWGVADTRGNEIAPCIYTEIKSGFENGLLKVQKDKETFFINVRGEKIIPY